MCGACNQVIAEARSKTKKKINYGRALMSLGGAMLAGSMGQQLGGTPTGQLGGLIVGSGIGTIGGAKLYDYLKR
jgi:uncharacterized membrane protein